MIDNICLLYHCIHLIFITNTEFDNKLGHYLFYFLLALQYFYVFFIVLHGFRYHLTKPLYVLTNKLKNNIINLTWLVTNDMNNKTVTVQLGNYKTLTLIKKFKRIGKFASRFRSFFSFTYPVMEGIIYFNSAIKFELLWILNCRIVWFIVTCWYSTCTDT